MMRPALRRSVWFWLGCFVLGFLVWAWADSWRMRTEVSRTWFLRSSVPGGFPVLGLDVDSAAVDCGSVWICWHGVRITEPSIKVEMNPVEFLREATDGEDEWFAMPGVSREVENDVPGAMVTSTVVQVPLWVVVVLYLMGCGGVLAWRRRKWNKVLLDGGASV